MLLATSQNITSITATTGGDPAQTYNDLIDFTFDTTASSGTSSAGYVLSLNVANVTYVGIAGHNIGSLGATVTINNHGVNDVVNYAPIDDRPIMFAIPARSGGSFTITISKSSATDVVIISHIASGSSTDLTSNTALGQEVKRDYESSYNRIPMAINRKVRTTINESGAPTATLTKTISAKMKLNIKNVPTEFAKVNLLAYQKFWVDNGFFMQNDDEIDQSYMAFQFVPASPKAHPLTRELVNLSYQFLAYNGQ